MTSEERGRALAGFLETMAGEPVVWGRSDCTAWLAQWLDIAAGLHVRLPVYAARDDALALIAAAGGLAELWRPELARLGLREIHPDDALVGDVGVIRLTGHDAGYLFADAWRGFVRAERAGSGGVSPISRRRLVAAWALP